MSTQRKKSSGFLGKGPNGRNLCFCGCGREVVRPRLNWFSDQCVESWKLINDPATIRRAVERRDRAICAECGVDCDLERRIQNQTTELWRWLARREAERLMALGELPSCYGSGMAKSWSECYDWANRWVAEDTKKAGWATTGHTWEADHIIPVVEGGGLCGLDNYRTLCIACHHKASAALARRRAEARRAAKNKQEALAL